MNYSHPSGNQGTIQVWADIGGTFTDCFVLQDGRRFELKVLSSGLTRTSVFTIDLDGTCTADPLLGSNSHHFWCGATATLIDHEGLTLALGHVLSHEGNHLRFERLDRNALNQLRAPFTLELDAHLEAPVLATHLLLGIPIRDSLPSLDVRLGTTKGTNALLTRGGAKMALLVTKGFHDLLEIGEQDRPDLFALNIKKHLPLAEHVIEIDERLDASGKVLRSIPNDVVKKDLEDAAAKGIQSVAICLLHSHRNSIHEEELEKLVRQSGFQEISRSSEIAPLIKYVSRAETTSLDAYLNPILREYLQRVWLQFGGTSGCRLQLMTSNGNLVEPARFRGKDSILSGPAGGVVALGELASRTAHPKVIGLDMGGTSTDVSRFEGKVGRRYESRVAGIRVLTPMMDIETVAAGGGSICSVSKLGRLSVGPESAGAEPGPACYGKGGPLTVTDINLILGRIPADRFPFPLDLAASQKRLRELSTQSLDPGSVCDEALAEGFFDIAVTHIAEAVRTVSTAQGSDVREMALAGFGGAAGQHLCRIADTLGMTTIIDHPDSGLLSALGIGIATVGEMASKGIYKHWDGKSPPGISKQLDDVKQTVTKKISIHSTDEQIIHHRFEIDIRYQGTESPITLPLEPQNTLAQRYHQNHFDTFGYQREDHTLEIVAIRCEALVTARGTVRGTDQADGVHAKMTGLTSRAPKKQNGTNPSLSSRTRLWHRNRWLDASLIDRDQLSCNQVVRGPTILAGSHSTLVLEPGWEARVTDDGIVMATRTASIAAASDTDEDNGKIDQWAGGEITRSLSQPSSDHQERDPILLEVISRRLQGIADAMGEVLRRTSLSVNIKERRDYSCAIFTKNGQLVANAPHVPVHLGAMGHTVRHLMNTYPEMHSGDCYLSNDPFSGGSHLPDVTAISPVFCDDRERGKPDFFVASRAHHAEIGGISPGSMPPHATCLAEEGVLIRDFALVRNGQSARDQLRLLLCSGDYPSRCPDENLADIDAQRAAGMFGVKSVQGLAGVYPPSKIHSIMSQILELSGETVQKWIQTLPRKALSFRDQLDDGTSLGVKISRQGKRLHLEFETGAVHPNGFNATPAIVTAVVLYVFRCLAGSQLPLTEGALRDVTISIPSGMLNPPSHQDPTKCAAVVAGNVETSQRVADVILGALQLAAASQGTMNNLLLGDATFGYYETIAGGGGATVTGPGADAVHTHMTNTRITDPEVLESRLPVRLHQFAIRQNSGGAGKHRGGNGVIREFEFLRPLVLSLITSRRTTQPYGLQSGMPGQPGRNYLLRRENAATSTADETPQETLGFRSTIEVQAGDRLVIETPGGGGWGAPRE